MKLKRKFSQTRIIALGFLTIIAIGTLLLMLPFASKSGESAGFVPALFTAVSSSCVTGLIVLDTATSWSLFGQIVIICLIQVGGLGFMTIATMFSMLLKRKLGLREKEIMVESINTEHIGSIRNITGKIIAGTAIFEGAGALLLATSSQTSAYDRIDKTDDIPCHINWAIVNAPAYGTTDAESGIRASRQGYGADVTLSDVFKFDEKTCPMSLHHGGVDPYAPYSSTLVYRRLRCMGIPAELHLYADKGHGALGLERGVEFMRQMGYMGELAAEEKLMDRYADDSSRAIHIKQDIWPEGKTPDFMENQCVPYMEWHIPDTLKTTAIQIIYSGGAYASNDPDGFEATPMRRYLNEKGMAVVTLKYRTPRPTGLAKHTSAWQDLQRTIKIVRSQAKEKGLDPDRIGIMGNSAGGHLTLMGTTSSRHQSYGRIDDIDLISCKVQWGVGIYPAYVLSDGFNGKNKGNGNGKTLGARMEESLEEIEENTHNEA